MIRISQAKAFGYGTAALKAQAGKMVLVPAYGEYFWLGHMPSGFYLVPFKQAA